MRPVYGDAVASGALNPQAFDHFWVEAGATMSGGSGNQLELPRQAHAFFTQNVPSYDSDQRVIDILRLHARGRNWDDRKLTWHGNNRMERLNLPTSATGGFADYARHVALFSRRHDGGFDLRIAPIGSDEAEGWVTMSATRGQLYSLGGSLSDRTCGHF